MFGRGTRPAEATIVTRRLIEQSHGGEGGALVSEVYEYIADVRPDDGMTLFRATIHEPLNAIHFRSPEVGQVVRVTFRDKDRHVSFDRDDPGLHRDLGHRREDKAAVAAVHTPQAQAGWEAIAAAVPGSAAAPAPASAPGPDATPADVDVQAQIRAASEAFNAASSHMSAIFAAFAAAKQAGDEAAIARAKAAVPAANAEVQRLDAELKRLRAS